MSHTPGPWVLRSLPGKKSSEGDNYAVITTPSGAAFDFISARTIPPEQHYANALIAATAPDLLAALRDLREAAIEAYKAGRIPAEPFVRAGNVIAKAEGK